jgi:hypothetical protein
VITGSIPEIVVGCLVQKVVLAVLAGKSDNDSFNRQRALLGADEKRAHQYLNRRNTGDRETASAGGLSRFHRGGAGSFGAW